jgi:hypothetical protein
MKKVMTRSYDFDGERSCGVLAIPLIHMPIDRARTGQGGRLMALQA